MEWPYSPLKFLYNNDTQSWIRSTTIKWNDDVYLFTNFFPSATLTKIQPSAINFDDNDVTTAELFEFFTPALSSIPASFESNNISYEDNLYFRDDKVIYKFNGTVISNYLQCAFDIQDFYIKEDIFYILHFDHYNSYITTEVSGGASQTNTLWTCLESLYLSDEDANFIDWNGDLYVWIDIENTDDYYHHYSLHKVDGLTQIFYSKNLPLYFASGLYEYYTDYQLNYKRKTIVFDGKLFICKDDRLYVITKDEFGVEVVNYYEHGEAVILSGLFSFNDKLFVLALKADYTTDIMKVNADYSLTTLANFTGYAQDVFTDGKCLFLAQTGIFIYDETADTFTYRNFNSFGYTGVNYGMYDYFEIDGKLCPIIADADILTSSTYYGIYIGYDYTFLPTTIPCLENEQTDESSFFYKKDSVIPVEKQLVLACDSSGSISTIEYNLQIEGYADAFREVAPYIDMNHKIVVCMTQWSSWGEAAVVIPWTILYDENSVYSFANLIQNVERLYSGSTACVAGLLHANELLQNSDYEGEERIIDISSDGDDNNTPGNLLFSRPPEDVFVNAITIDEAGSNYIFNWYSQNIIQGPDKFAIGVDNFTDFQSAMLLKLEQELDIEEEEPVDVVDDTEIVDEVVVSPLISIKEIDFTATAIAHGKIGVIILRNTYKGTEKERIFITNERELTEMFGKPSTNTDCVQDMLSAIAYLRDSDKLYCTRVMPADARFAGTFCTQGTSATFVGFNESNAPVLDVDLFNPDRYHEEVGDMYDSVLMNVIAINRGTFGNNIRIALVDRDTYDQIKLRLHSDYQIYNDVSKIDSALSDIKNFLVIVQERNIITNTWSTVEVHNVSSDRYAVDDTGGKLFVESKINTSSKYIRVAWNSLFLDTDMTYHFTQTYQRLSGGYDGSVTTVPDETIIAALDLYQNSEEVDINFLIDSNKSDTVKSYMIDICERRKDCVAVLDCHREHVVHNIGNEVVDLSNWRDNTFNENSSYAAVYGSWLKIKNKFTKKEIWMPSSGYVAGIYSRSDNISEPWYAPAGHNRAMLKEVERLSWHPNVDKRDILYQHGINCIVTFAGEGHIVWGQKNLLAKSSAFNRVNIRRLFLTLEKTIATAAHHFTFEPNNEGTRMVFTNLVEPFLKDVKAKNGISEFLIISNEANNTPERIDRNEMWFNIFIKPTHMVEYIVLEFIVTKEGAKFLEIANILDPKEYKYVKEGYL